jgi:methylenetetrahydrofolate dehydrogenase (NADP+)/methenyltetrahydrofolate cyclohydrolase
VTDRLEGAPVVEELDRASRDLLRSAPTEAGRPCLASVHLGTEGPFERYLRGQRKAAGALGIRFREEVLERSEGGPGLVARVRTLDRDPTVHGVILEHPLPDPYDFASAIAELRPEKDVDGVGATSLGRLVSGRPSHAPAVCLAALAIARHYGLSYTGVPVTVVGRSPTVGLPLALLLAQRFPGPNATVTVAHSKTPDLAATLASARTVFSCAGHPRLLTRSLVPKGAAVVDIGLSTLPSARTPGASVLSGDADPESLDGWASAVTPVPGGVGPVTVAQLMWNTVKAWRWQTHTGEVP